MPFHIIIFVQERRFTPNDDRSRAYETQSAGPAITGVARVPEEEEWRADLQRVVQPACS